MKVKFVVPGEPKGKGRPRFQRVGAKGVRTYTPDTTATYENLVKVMYFNAAGNLTLTGPLSIRIDAFFPIPKSASKIKRSLMLEQTVRPTVKCDADNIAKIVLDGLNEVAFADDKQVVQMTVLKWYAEEPKVVVSIGELDGTIPADAKVGEWKTIDRKERNND